MGSACTLHRLLTYMRSRVLRDKPTVMPRLNNIGTSTKNWLTAGFCVTGSRLRHIVGLDIVTVVSGRQIRQTPQQMP